jgi:nitrite reductase/ring-hydroxylating ferredoxin subunit
MVSASSPRPAPRPAVTVTGEWVTLAARAAHVTNGSVLKTTADGDPVLIARTGDVFYAYVAKCPACESAMEAASLDGAVLVCDRCSGRYDIRRAGAGVGSDFRIEPLPLLEESGVLRIAIPARPA